MPTYSIPYSDRVHLQRSTTFSVNPQAPVSALRRETTIRHGLITVPHTGHFLPSERSLACATFAAKLLSFLATLASLYHC